jgi:hypothetical protein
VQPKLLASPARIGAIATFAALPAWETVRWLGRRLTERLGIEPIGSGPPLFAALLTLLVVALHLLAEEKRLVTELRTARAGTGVMRQLALRRRRATPWFVRWISTSVGSAAVLLAEGEVGAAEHALAWSSPLFWGKSLGALRAVVEADAKRARGDEASLGEAIRALYGMDPLSHPEAERYRLHVLVKALLEQADGATARELAETLALDPDEDRRVYWVWLRAWFGLDQLPQPASADIALARLLARAHGADDLVKRLSEPLGVGDAVADARSRG